MKLFRYLKDAVLDVVFWILEKFESFWWTCGRAITYCIAIVIATGLVAGICITFASYIPSSEDSITRQRGRAEYIKLLEEQNALLQKLLLEIQK